MPVQTPFAQDKKYSITARCKKSQDEVPATSSKVQPLFGERDSMERHFDRWLPAGGLGPSVPVSTIPSQQKFGGLEMKLFKGSQRPGVAVGTRESRNDVRLAISLHGQWKGLRGEGTELRTGSFRYPLFGDAMYEGQLVNGRRHGKGTQVSHRGVYTGEFKDGEINGRGKRQYVDGGIYVGEWKGGLKHGRGKLSLANGDEYHGDFVEGKMHGEGVYKMSNGDWYDGEFVQGAMEGEGRYTYGEGRGVYVGTMRANEMDGHGTYECVEDEELGQSFVYTGDFERGRMHGSGIMQMSCGDRYEGDFQNGLFDGEGEYVYADGSAYKGGWHRGKMHHFGVFQSPVMERDVETYSGEWKNGKRHGKGVCEVLDNVTKRRERQEGTWYDGERDGKMVRDYGFGMRTVEEFSRGERVAWSVVSDQNAPRS